MSTPPCARHRFPPAIIRHAVWLHFRFALSCRDVERRDDSNQVYAPILARLRREIEAARELDDLFAGLRSSQSARAQIK